MMISSVGSKRRFGQTESACEEEKRRSSTHTLRKLKSRTNRDQVSSGESNWNRKQVTSLSRSPTLEWRSAASKRTRNETETQLKKISLLEAPICNCNCKSQWRLSALAPHCSHHTTLARFVRTFIIISVTFDRCFDHHHRSAKMSARRTPNSQSANRKSADESAAAFSRHTCVE